MRKSVLVLGMMVIAMACYPALAQTHQPGSPPGQPGQPGQVTPVPPGSEKPLITPTDLKPFEAQGMIPASKAISEAESHTKGKAVAVIPVRNPQNNEPSFQVYTLKDGQLAQCTIDAKSGKVLSSRSVTEIAELARTRLAAHEEPGARRPSAGEKPLFTPTDLKPFEMEGMTPLSKAVSDAESKGKGNAVAVIPLKNPQGEFTFQVYTLKDGQLSQFTIDAKTGKLISTHPANEIAELTTTHYAGHEEMGGERHPPKPTHP
jgi:uncharacterized membrane protein YkoI